jgi:hypothetical protein
LREQRIFCLLRLPEPMLARSGPIPRGRGWTFGPKLDGFRCLSGVAALCPILGV